MRIAGVALVCALSSACSSAETTGSSPTDGGSFVDASHEVQVIGGDSAADADVDTGDPIPDEPIFALTCMTDDDCDKTASGIAHCSNHADPEGPYDPTPICIQYDSGDVCTPTDETTIHFCDGNLGLCTKTGSMHARCEAMCIMSDDGTWQQKCAGKNGCNVVAFGTDAMTMKISLIGTCHGGCRADADCPSGSKCDPVQKFCAKGCAVDDDCTKGWSAPANWKCDTARGACAYVFAKKVGDACTSKDECLCLGGRCTRNCRPGDDCGAGFTCDPYLPAKDAAGAALFTLSTLPPELVGLCVPTCTMDADCGVGQACDLSAGLAEKTCRPKP